MKNFQNPQSLKVSQKFHHFCHTATHRVIVGMSVWPGKLLILFAVLMLFSLKLSMINAAELTDAVPDQSVLEIEAGRSETKIRQQRMDQQIVVTIDSAFGIDTATVKRKSASWPKSLVVRLHLQGLESFKVRKSCRCDDKQVLPTPMTQTVPGSCLHTPATLPDKLPLSIQTVEWSVLSHSGNRCFVTVSRCGQTETVEKGHPLHSPVTLKRDTASLKRIEYFEITMPKAMFEDNPEQIVLSWIDFFRN